VLYVLSSPHSGSTLLGTALGVHPEICFAGELFEIPAPAWVPGRPCSCGQPAAVCPFWHAVRERLEATTSVEEMRRGEAAYNRWVALPRVVVGRLTRSHALGGHARDLGALARAIQETSGKSIIIDTSKGASRGLSYELARSDEFEVKFLHLLRDGRGVVASRKSREARVSPTGTVDPNAALKYSILWGLANLAFVALFAPQADRHLRLRYEDFTRDPEGTIRRLAEFLEVPPEPVIEHLRAHGEFPTGHVVAGNRLRLGGGVRIRPATSDWEERLTPRERRTYAAVASWAARLFGYAAR